MNTQFSLFDRSFFWFNRKNVVVLINGFEGVMILCRNGDKYKINGFRDDENNNLLLYVSTFRQIAYGEKTNTKTINDFLGIITQTLSTAGFKNIKFIN